MLTFCRKLAPIFMLFIAFALIEGGLTVNDADARSRMGGRSFRSTPFKKAPVKNTRSAQQRSGGFGRGLAGGLIGGALGGMLFGSMFGAGGSGMGILPMLLLGGVAYFLFRKYSRSGQSKYQSNGRQPGQQNTPNILGGAFGGNTSSPPPPPDIGQNLLDDGLAQIRQSDSGFDEDYFLEIASDVFFKVQAGWMRRDLSSYRYLLGEQLAGEYEQHFEEMLNKGQINKLESIAIRTIKIVQAGSDNGEDFVTVLFTANLLDYTVDEKSGDVVEGSMTDPVKFKEEWTWARSVGTQDWKLEGIK